MGPGKRVLYWITFKTNHSAFFSRNFAPFAVYHLSPRANGAKHASPAARPWENAPPQTKALKLRDSLRSLGNVLQKKTQK
jgi:hypothetical protein